MANKGNEGMAFLSAPKMFISYVYCWEEGQREDWYFTFHCIPFYIIWIFFFYYVHFFLLSFQNILESTLRIPAYSYAPLPQPLRQWKSRQPFSALLSSHLWKYLRNSVYTWLSKATLTTAVYLFNLCYCYLINTSKTSKWHRSGLKFWVSQWQVTEHECWVTQDLKINSLRISKEKLW
jgi:hypothetical protein